MRKYLFDKIEIMGKGFKFIPYRKATIGESFMALTNSSMDKNKWEFFPVTFNEFLKMLSKTKVNKENEYDIFMSSNTIPAYYTPVEFDAFLKDFVKYVYSDKEPNEELISKFYQKAYQIKAKAVKDREILNKNPQDYIK